MVDALTLYSSLFPAPRFILKVPGRKIVVLAPHPDDEIIGCGGAVCKHLLSRDHVIVVYLTNGTRPRAASSTEIDAANRLQEARRALAILGVQENFFLDLPCGNLTIDSDSSNRVASILNESQPDLIYAPHLQDKHPDHFATNLLLSRTLPSLVAPPKLVAGYEIWSPLQPTLLVNITDYFSLKLDALNAYASQVETYDYPSLVDRLGRYRATLHHPTRESFLVAVEERRLHARHGLSCRIPWTHLETFRALPTSVYMKEVNQFVRKNFEEDAL